MGTFSAALKLISLKFSDVEQLSTNHLADMLNVESSKNVKLFDCREENEYAVSHIPTAQLLAPASSKDEICETLSQLDINVPLTIVCYCSIGYRSSEMARRMKDCQMDQNSRATIVNLEGSIFKWANENRPLLNPANEATLLVHPYSSLWGRFLERNRWPDVWN